MSILIDLSKTQQYLKWLETKLYLNSISSKAKKRIIKRGEVYNCYLGHNIGSEESKKRPCVILQGDSANTTSSNTIVAPITHTSSTLPIVIPIKTRQASDGTILLDGNVLLGNIVCISKARLDDYIDKLTPVEMNQVDEAIAISMDIKKHYDKLNNILTDKLDYVSRLKKKISKLQTDLSIKNNELEEINKLKDKLGVTSIHELNNKIYSLIENK